MTILENKLTAKSFKSDQEIRWCPGCGDFGILNSVQKALAELDYPKENYAVISGIGCSSRFPYYMNTYGFHTIHGRAAAIASGAKVANNDLKILQISGDGDALAIGGNHYIHAIRRNIDINIMIFNNEIYGLTKGQFSPTSKAGKITKTSPTGTFENPFSAGELALGAGANFFARSVDVNMKLTASVVKESIEFEGTGVTEILQNCVIFNDKTHAAFFDKENKINNFIILEHGKPMLFGKGNSKGIIINKKGILETVNMDNEGVSIDDILVHDAQEPTTVIHRQLIEMSFPENPIAMGVIRAVKKPTYDHMMQEHLSAQQTAKKITCMDDLLNSGQTWEV